MASLSKKLPRCGFLMFWGVTSIIYAILFEGIEFVGSPISGMNGLIIIALQWMAVSLSAASVIGLLALNRIIFAMTFPVMITLSAIAAYFKLTLGASVTTTVIELIVVNDLTTWSTLITWQLIAVGFVGLAVGVLAVIYRLSSVDGPEWPWALLVLFVTGVLMPIYIVPRLKAPIVARMPYSFIYSIKDYFANRQIVAEQRHTFDNVPARSDADSLTVVVVIGESLRADHLSLNGYQRLTTPRLNAEKTLVSVPGMWTDPYFTHRSVPHIMTRADSINEEVAFKEQSFIALFKKAGFLTAWFSNQDAVDSYAYFMHEADTLLQCNNGRSLYDYGKWLDSDMLPVISRFFAEDNPKKLAVIHTIGSHWWYRSHYPDSLARYKPEINSRIVSELSPESMINSYDNTILATDAFIFSLVEGLRERNAIVIFISDHGESLGEGGRYLHASDAEELHHTACFVWYSTSFLKHYPEKISVLKRNSQMPQRTDVIFHTVLDAGDISTPVLIPSLSLFQQ